MIRRPRNYPASALTRASLLGVLALATSMLCIPGTLHCQSLSQDIAPTTLSPDLADGRALFVNPALMAAEPMARWDLMGAMEGNVVSRGLLSLTGPHMHMGYRYDSGPTPPRSELRVGAAYGTPAAGFGYALRFQRESVWGRGAGSGVDLGLFFRPNPNATVSWALRNAGDQPRMEHRHQLIGISLRPGGSKFTLSGELRWDDGGFRTNLLRWGARAQVTPMLEISACYQPPRLAGSPEVRLGVSFAPPGFAAHAAHQIQQSGRGGATWLGLSGTPAAARRRPPG